MIAPPRRQRPFPPRPREPTSHYTTRRRSNSRGARPNRGPAMGLDAKLAHARDRREAPKPRARAIAPRRDWPPQLSTQKMRPQSRLPTLP